MAKAAASFNNNSANVVWLRHVAIWILACSAIAIAGCGGGSDSTAVSQTETVPPPIHPNGVVSGFKVAQDQIVEQPSPEVIDAFQGGEEGAAEGSGGETGGGGGTGDGSISRENLRIPLSAPRTRLGCRNRARETAIQLERGIAVNRGTSRDGGIGVGGMPGKFSGVTITVKYPDGTVLGSAPVDAERGMVTVYPGVDYRGGLEIEVSGSDDGQYFDPGSQQLQPFPTGKTLRVYVGGIRGNIAVSALTDVAAARVDAFRNSLTNPLPPATLEQRYDSENANVGAVINACLPAAYRIADITRLPDSPGQDTGSPTSQAPGRSAKALPLPGTTKVSNDSGSRHIIALTALSTVAGSHLRDLVSRGQISPGQTSTLFQLVNHLKLDLLEDQFNPMALDGGRTGYDIQPGVIPAPVLPAARETAYPTDSTLHARVISAVSAAVNQYGDSSFAALPPVTVDLTCKVTLTGGVPGTDQVRSFTYDPVNDSMTGISGGVVSVSTLFVQPNDGAYDHELGDISAIYHMFMPFQSVSTGEFIAMNDFRWTEETIPYPPRNAVNFRVVARRSLDFKPVYYFKHRVIYAFGNTTTPAIDETFECS